MPDFRDDVPATTFVPGDVALIRRGAGAAAIPAAVQLGDAATRSTGAAAGQVPLLDAEGKLAESMLPEGTGGGSGADGREVELRTTATHIQWRYVGEAAWTDLIALSALQGPPGGDGQDGADGSPDTAEQIRDKLQTLTGVGRLDGPAVRRVVVRVVHGGTAGTARPAGADFVEWVGTVAPTNAAENDTWVNPA